LAGLCEDLRPVLRQERLVRRDHILARGEGLQHDLQRRLGAAQQLDDDRDFRVVAHARPVGDDSIGRHGNIPAPGSIAHERALDLDPLARAPGDPVAGPTQEPGDARPHRAQPQ
jgi:hypothetical protein